MKYKNSNKSYYMNIPSKNKSNDNININNDNKNDNSLNIKNPKKYKIKTKTNRNDQDSLNWIKKFILLKKKEKKIKDDSKAKIKSKQSKNSLIHIKKNKKKKIIKTTFDNCLNNIKKIKKNIKEDNYCKIINKNLINKINFISFNENKINNKSFNNRVKKSIKKLVIQKKCEVNLYNNNNKKNNICKFTNKSKNKIKFIKKNNRIKNSLYKVLKPKYYFDLKFYNFVEFKYEFFENLNYLRMLNNISLINSNNKKVDFGLNLKKPTVILDLDETLIHTYEKEKKDEHDFIIEFLDSDSSKNKEIYFVNIRPHFNEFVKFLKKTYNIIIFTASEKIYADKILNILDPNNIYFNRRLYRNNCVKTNNNNYIKDLTIIKNIDLNNTLIVDNCIFSFILNLKNGIIIFPFKDNKNDKELLKLIEYLKYLNLFINNVKENEKYFNYNNWNKEMINYYV